MQFQIKKKIIALILARGNSKSIPNKNIVSLNGHPLIAWSIAACKLSKKINETIVSTDSKKIVMISKRYGAKVPFYRPAKFARDDSTDFDALKHFVNWWENNNKNLIDMIVQIRPTTPFRDPKVIDEAIKIFKKRKQFTGLRSVFEMVKQLGKLLNLKKLFITFIEKFV